MTSEEEFSTFLECVKQAAPLYHARSRTLESRRLRVEHWAERVRRLIAGRIDEEYIKELDREAIRYGRPVVGFESRVRVPVITRTFWGEIPLRALRMRDGWRFQPNISVLTRVDPVLRSKPRRRVQRMLPWWSLEELNRETTPTD